MSKSQRRSGWKRMFGKPSKASMSAAASARKLDPLNRPRSSPEHSRLLPDHALSSSGDPSQQDRRMRASPAQDSDVQGLEREATAGQSQQDTTELDLTTFREKIKPASTRRNVDKRKQPAGIEKSKPGKPPSEETIKRTRSVLSRPFGRDSLPLVNAQRWVVEVSPAEWDADKHRWRYRIVVQGWRASGSLGKSTPSSSNETARTCRSVGDFAWLEQALRAEFHGSLLLPLLSIYLGTPNVSDFSQNEVDPNLLRDWLSDVLNGTRGQGEVILPLNVDLRTSEALEAFLYRNTDPLFVTFPSDSYVSAATSVLDDPWRTSPQKSFVGGPDESFVSSLWTKPLSCLPTSLDEMCNPPGAVDTPPRPRELTKHVPLEMVNCSARMTRPQGDAMHGGTTMLETFPRLRSPALRSQLLEAERELAMSYRKSAMSAMDKLHTLTENESQSGVGWKRFAITLSNLYMSEKDLGSIRLDEMKGSGRKGSHRKLGKKNVDELLRVMIKQKTERATVGLRELNAMLGAYIGDLSSVGPALGAYAEAVVQLTHLEVSSTDLKLPSTNAIAPAARSIDQNKKDSGWHSQLQAVASTTFLDVKNHMGSGSVTSDTTGATSSLDGESALRRREAFKERVVENESRLENSLTSLCAATTTRTSRMAWQFYSKEIEELRLLLSAAHSMRTKINIIDRDKLASMIARHKNEVTADDALELNLVQRILDIDKSKTFPKAITSDEADKPGHDITHLLLRDEALLIARGRLGRWDAKLALAIMRAIGAGADAEVRVDETTRDLRLVRKYAIGLRDKLTRCVEALDIVKSIVLHGEGSSVSDHMNGELTNEARHLRESRERFTVSIASVWSGRLVESDLPDSPSVSSSIPVLSIAGIKTGDLAGWESSSTDEKKDLDRGGCGENLKAYSELRDFRTYALLTKLSILLEDYQQRVEGIESYVYMGCVGIQLEKFYSQKRRDALAAFEQKTDIETAIHIATRKRLPLLVAELEAKREKVASVSHTDVKQLKETHLTSKSLKAELAALALRRFLRAREASQEQVIDLITQWAKYEEETANIEISVLRQAMDEVERTFLSVTAEA